MTIVGQISESDMPAVADTPVAARLTDVVKTYELRQTSLFKPRPTLQAVAGVNLTIGRGESVGLVGESGSGKSTVARLLMRLVPATAGKIEVGGQDITNLRGEALRAVRRRVQMVFQDPYSSLDPTSTIGDSIAEPLVTHFKDMSAHDRNRRVRELLEHVNLSAKHLERYPSEMSGGQLQRAAIARAISVKPELLVLDEPVSALDVSTQSQVLNLLKDLQEQDGLSYLFISHDLSIVRYISQRIAVMYLGRIVETGPVQRIYGQALHPYTRSLLSAVPVADPARQRSAKRQILKGDIPSPTSPPSGCRFRTRCPVAMPVCSVEDPPPYTLAAGGGVSFCHLNHPLPDGHRLA